MRQRVERVSDEVEDASEPRHLDAHHAGVLCAALVSSAGVGALLTHLAYQYGWAGAALFAIMVVVTMLAFADTFLAS